MIKNPSIKRFIWGFSLLVAVFVNFPFIALQLPHLSIGEKPPHFDEHPPDRPPHLEGHQMAGWDIFVQISVCLLFAVAIIFYFNRSFHLKKTKPVFYPFLFFLAFTASLSLLNYYFIGIQEGVMVVTVISRGVLIVGISYVFSNFLYETEQKNIVLLENENLKLENITIQLNSLKNQLNPHFLFNSLNTLSWLINEDKDKSQKYLQKLSQVLRYSLSMQEQSLVSLKEELTLLNSYIFLLQIRFGENLQITKDLVDIERYKIPPLSLQLLVENAIKHNVISTAKPMYLKVSTNTTNQTLTVSNSLHLKQNSEGTGIGLVNLNERFRILANREIEIHQNKDFTVILPLIV